MNGATVIQSDGFTFTTPTAEVTAIDKNTLLPSKENFTIHSILVLFSQLDDALQHCELSWHNKNININLHKSLPYLEPHNPFSDFDFLYMDHNA